MKTNLFPIEFNGKLYYEKDCDEFYLGYYTSRFLLCYNSGIYLGEDMYLYPDGEIAE